ncbi:adenosylcobinamide amidohydrolase [Fodinisporobacter ferrooxydans]|uniref:Adenosylcobinamide amidohydrolase n=1 Tax=Fodinisporobacter ferrooxydans TaxID=2901836 RepID=A0ABY4CPN1_9BACL|nr:adenosylcobinamide amidohydrolase [Alicyclobacillaceae bacterium MYW30-H2]
MAQPFRQNTQVYRPKLFPKLSIAFKGDHICFQSAGLLHSYSSALWGGGQKEADCFVNWKVPLQYQSSDPQRMMCEQLANWGYSIDSSIGLQTAAKLTHASIVEEAGDAFRLLCCTTVGTGNRTRAGKFRKTYSAYRCGTINTFLFIAGHLMDAAMINAIITATEGKTAALQDLKITDDDDQFATGTTTDAIVVAAERPGHDAPVHRYAGTATTLGNAIGRLVYQTVYEAGSTQGDP